MLFHLFVASLSANFVCSELLNDAANRAGSQVDIRHGCKGQLGNPTVNNGLRQRHRLNVCYCDPELYRNDPAGCQMVCGSDGVKSSTRLTECNCVEDSETCRKWLCRLGNEEKAGLYCRTANQSLAQCRHAGQSNLNDFDECQCGNGGWRNDDGFCECPTYFFGPTCELDLNDQSKRQILSFFDDQNNPKQISLYANDIDQRRKVRAAFPDQQWHPWDSGSGMRRDTTSTKTPTTTSLLISLGSSDRSWMDNSSIRVAVIVVGGILFGLALVGCAYLCVAKCEKRCCPSGGARRVYLVMNRTPPELEGVTTVYLHDPSQPGTAGQGSSQMTDSRTIVVTAHSPSAPRQEPSATDALLPDKPTAYRRAASPNEPFEAEQAPPPYQEVIRQENTPKTSSDSPRS